MSSVMPYNCDKSNRFDAWFIWTKTSELKVIQQIQLWTFYKPVRLVRICSLSPRQARCVRNSNTTANDCNLLRRCQRWAVHKPNAANEVVDWSRLPCSIQLDPHYLKWFTLDDSKKPRRARLAYSSFGTPFWQDHARWTATIERAPHCVQHRPNLRTWPLQRGWHLVPDAFEWKIRRSHFSVAAIANRSKIQFQMSANVTDFNHIVLDSFGQIPYTIHLHIWRAAIFDMCSNLSHRVGGWPHIRRVNRPAANDKLTKFAHRFVHRCQIYSQEKRRKHSAIEALN